MCVCATQEDAQRAAQQIRDHDAETFYMAPTVQLVWTTMDKQGEIFWRKVHGSRSVPLWIADRHPPDHNAFARFEIRQMPFWTQAPPPPPPGAD